jgi:hypothetical protein
MAVTLPGIPAQVVRKFWFPGWTYNTTPGSRARLTQTFVNGSVFCIDPEAAVDFATLPSGMVIQPEGDSAAIGRRITNVTRPQTGILSLIAGVLVNAPGDGLRGDRSEIEGGYLGGCWIDLVVDAEAVEALVQGDVSASDAYDSVRLGAVDGQPYLAPVAVGSNGINIRQQLAAPLFRENVASAALRPVRLARLPLG